MKRFRYGICLAFLLALFPLKGAAQQLGTVIVAACGTAPAGFTAGVILIDRNGLLCTSGTGSGTVTQGTSPWVVASNATSAARTARGTTITTGGTSQTLVAANASRKGFTIQNPCSLTTQGIAAAESLFINFTSAATVNTSANAVELTPCASYSEGLNGGAVTQEAITGVSATTGHIVYIKEF